MFISMAINPTYPWSVWCETVSCGNCPPQNHGLRQNIEGKHTEKTSKITIQNIENSPYLSRVRFEKLCLRMFCDEGGVDDVVFDEMPAEPGRLQRLDSHQDPVSLSLGLRATVHWGTRRTWGNRGSGRSFLSQSSTNIEGRTLAP